MAREERKAWYDEERRADLTFMEQEIDLFIRRGSVECDGGDDNVGRKVWDNAAVGNSSAGGDSITEK